MENTEEIFAEIMKRIADQRQRDEDVQRRMTESYTRGAKLQLVEKETKLFRVTDHEQNKLPRGKYFEMTLVRDDIKKSFLGLQLKTTKSFRWAEMPSDQELLDAYVGFYGLKKHVVAQTTKKKRKTLLDDAGHEQTSVLADAS